MTLRLTHLHVAAVALAIGAVSMAGTSARAFTMENMNASGGGSNFADPDDQVKNLGPAYKFSGPGGPTVQFGTQPQQPLGRFQGFAPASPPPLPYARPPGNGD